MKKQTDRQTDRPWQWIIHEQETTRKVSAQEMAT